MFGCLCQPCNPQECDCDCHKLTGPPMGTDYGAAVSFSAEQLQKSPWPCRSCAARSEAECQCGAYESAVYVHTENFLVAPPWNVIGKLMDDAQRVMLESIGIPSEVTYYPEELLPKLPDLPGSFVVVSTPPGPSPLWAEYLQAKSGPQMFQPWYLRKHWPGQFNPELN